VQRTVDQLVARRLVELKPNVDHQRAGLVTLSDDGRRILAALESRQQAWLGRCLRGLARTDLEHLTESLGALTARVEAATAREPDAGRSRGNRTYRRWGVAP